MIKWLLTLLLTVAPVQTTPMPNEVPVSEPTPPTVSRFTVSAVTEVQAAQQFPDIPQTLKIPAIGLTEVIVPVGLTAAGIVDVSPTQVGWYTGGVRPGEVGVASLDGHFINASGKPGVFNRLAQVVVGNEISVEDTQHQEWRFTVTETEVVPVEAFSVEKVYGHREKPTLTLVTCAGQYIGTAADYSHRTIVYAELVPDGVVQ